MCTGIEMFQVAATAFSAISSIQQGKEAQRAHDFQAAQAQADAQAEREYGQLRAEKVRKAGKAQQSEARAALAASGLEVGAGTPLLIEQTIGRNAEESAMQEILYGSRKGARLDQEAQAERAAGERARAGGYRGAAGSVLRGGATLIGPGWKSAAKRDTSGDFLYDTYDSGAVRIG